MRGRKRAWRDTVHNMYSLLVPRIISISGIVFCGLWMYIKKKEIEKWEWMYISIVGMVFILALTFMPRWK